MISRIFTYISLLACLATIAYIVFFTQNRYISISQFSVVVKNTNGVDVSSGLMGLVGGNSTGDVDTQATIGFIKSADLLIEIEKEFDLVTHYSSPKKDFYYRLDKAAPLEERLEYYRERIVPKYNATNGMIELDVDTFSPELSYQVSQSILKKTEHFINNLNQEVAEKRLNFARNELDRAQNTITRDENALLAFQKKHKIIHPEPIITAKLEAIQTLRLDKIRKEIELATLRANSPQSPSINSLKTTIETYEMEISAQEKAFAGEDQSQLSTILAEYKQLELNLEFGIKLREGAEILLEKTRAEAISTSRFFSVIQNPYLSEEYAHPRRFYLSATVAVIFLLGIYILRALLSSILDRN